MALRVSDSGSKSRCSHRGLAHSRSPFVASDFFGNLLSLGYRLVFELSPFLHCERVVVLPAPSGWEDVGDDKVLAALRSLEAMGFVDSLGADACLARVQMHMMSTGAVDLDAAVADLVTLMKPH